MFSKKQSYQEKIRATSDIEWLRTELLRNHCQTNKLHRRTQQLESLMAGMVEDNRESEARIRDLQDKCFAFMKKNENFLYDIFNLPYLQLVVVKRLLKGTSLMSAYKKMFGDWGGLK